MTAYRPSGGSRPYIAHVCTALLSGVAKRSIPMLEREMRLAVIDPTVCSSRDDYGEVNGRYNGGKDDDRERAGLEFVFIVQRKLSS